MCVYVARKVLRINDKKEICPTIANFIIDYSNNLLVYYNT
ncbi:hypothetical protein APHMUC_0942 [Anaplasma phagocytophilum str. ApMUC09]|uniref:Uncharacterized protein n=1 Tax=Anaplasma phagocytophilum str. ApMUC09 TaxID=1359152 RepID=A0A0F3N999_ANAPH|nr:hypothetical protein APHMUC_0942 [Anaplasma phagocytophilum str. ApMUC09]